MSMPADTPAAVIRRSGRCSTTRCVTGTAPSWPRYSVTLQCVVAVSRVDGEAEHAVLGADLAAPLADEHDVERGYALQHLVGPDRVERGQAGEQGDGDLHGHIRSSGGTAAKRRR
jgi:hypothetical protein